MFKILFAPCDFTGDDISSIPSTGSGHGISSNNSKVNAGRLVYVFMQVNNDLKGKDNKLTITFSALRQYSECPVKSLYLFFFLPESHLIEVLTVNRSDNKRPYSPSRQRSGNLRPVAEENSLHYIYPNYPTTNIDPNFYLASVDENNGLTPDQGI